MLAAPENGYARTPAIPQAVLDNGGPHTITPTRLENEESIDIDGRLDEAILYTDRF